DGATSKSPDSPVRPSWRPSAATTALATGRPSSSTTRRVKGSGSSISDQPAHVSQPIVTKTRSRNWVLRDTGRISLPRPGSCRPGPRVLHRSVENQLSRWVASDSFQSRKQSGSDGGNAAKEICNRRHSRPLTSLFRRPTYSARRQPDPPYPYHL